MTGETSTESARTRIDRDAEGFLVDPSQWDRGLAEEIARECGIEELTPGHWQVIEFMRSRYLETGAAPSIRTLGKQSGVPVKELYRLFPKGPAKLAAKIGGIPKPRGCI
ncbi:MAG: TusE/DsrC/DsvC family sulfur relay protein [Thermoleophilia bacterium]|nr:TusE/DsrC/DsvC family sulfur relay protein [Gaiellaceae bacterium]MDW8338243.1 TusE/DsrC/DsvC family sulfur relay protein [Thermoleophilia bacterium]